MAWGPAAFPKWREGMPPQTPSACKWFAYRGHHWFARQALAPMVPLLVEAKRRPHTIECKSALAGQLKADKTESDSILEPAQQPVLLSA